MLRVGLLINPIAGIGGAAGLKGSDGLWQEALARGFQPHAHERAKRFVEGVEGVEWLCPPGVMGLQGLPHMDLPAQSLGETDARDTQDAAIALRDSGVDLVCFVGGDGTASDVAAAVDATVPCLGIPAGVKITSPVFAHDVDEAVWLVEHLDPGFETVLRDITDLDEEAYRAGRVDVVLKGALRVPMSPAIQGGKVPTTGDTPLEPLVEQCLRDWDPEAVHVIGAGSVCYALKKAFWGEPTLLGVDVVHENRIVAKDVDAPALDALVDQHSGPIELWLTIIGGQGMVLGRGTQVISPQTLRRIGWEHLHVVAPPEKLFGMRRLHVDSGDPDLDATAPDHVRVLVGWNEWRMVRLGGGFPEA